MTEALPQIPSSEPFQERLAAFLQTFKIRIEWSEPGTRIIMFNTVDSPSEATVLLAQIQGILAANDFPVVSYDWSTTEESVGAFLQALDKNVERKPVLLVDFTGQPKATTSYGEGALNFREQIMNYLGGVVIVNLPKDKQRLRELLPDLFTQRETGFSA
ncbi:MAG: hypothetical protein QX199_16780 [Methylococcaceae bacterium]